MVYQKRETNLQRFLYPHIVYPNPTARKHVFKKRENFLGRFCLEVDRCNCTKHVKPVVNREGDMKVDIEVVILDF